jgi:glycosidase
LTEAGIGGPSDGGVSSDFVFGTLATDDLRLAQLRAAAVGVRHGSDIDPRDPRPGEPVRVRVTLGPRVQADRVTCYYTTDGEDAAGQRGESTTGQALACERTNVEWDTLLWAYVETWIGTIPAQAAGTLVRYRIEAWSSAGGPSAWASEVAGMVAGEKPPEAVEDDALRFAADVPPLWPVKRRGSYAYAVDDERIPDWLRDAVIYHVFIDRFATGGDRPFAEPASLGGFFGGTLRGVIERLDHIIGLGATCLWLSPLFPSPSHHGYDTTDYAAVEPRLGTEEDLRDLIEAAHAAGIRVILDYVANHVSSAHPAFQAALADRSAPEASWFHFIRWPDRYLSFFGVPDHPQVDADDPEARGHLIAAARHWLDLGVDGFRCDYANGPSHAFWSEFRIATRQARTDSVTIGEVVETPALQRSYEGRLDGCLDFVLLQALRGFFAFGDRTASEFDAFLRRHLAFFGDDLVLPSFLDNHDMNRFLWIVGGDMRRLKLAALCQFTLPNPPIVYYGTEVGLSQLRDVRSADGSGHPEEARLPMPWNAIQDVDLLDFYRRLVAARRDHAGLWRGERRTLAIDDPTGLVAYRCESSDASAIVVLHNGDGVARFQPDTSERWRLCLVTDASVTFQEGVLTLPALAGAILVRADRE